MTKRVLGLLVLLAMAATLNSACSPSRADDAVNGPNGRREIAATQLSGTFENKPFVLGKAIASRIVDAHGEQVMITFAPAGYEFGCGMRFPDFYVGASAPTTPGSYAVDLDELQKQLQAGQRPQASAVFTKSGDPVRALIAPRALVRIDSINATEVRGGLYAEAKDGPNSYEVSGEFVAEVCE